MTCLALRGTPSLGGGPEESSGGWSSLGARRWCYFDTLGVLGRGSLSLLGRRARHWTLGSRELRPRKQEPKSKEGYVTFFLLQPFLAVFPLVQQWFHCTSSVSAGAHSSQACAEMPNPLVARRWQPPISKQKNLHHKPLVERFSSIFMKCRSASPFVSLCFTPPKSFDTPMAKASSVVKEIVEQVLNIFVESENNTNRTQEQNNIKNLYKKKRVELQLTRLLQSYQGPRLHLQNS